jgi:hypothetical protein
MAFCKIRLHYLFLLVVIVSLNVAIANTGYDLTGAADQKQQKVLFVHNSFNFNLNNKVSN